MPPLIDFPVLRTLSFLRLLARRADLSAILPLHSRRSPVLVSRGCAAYRGVSLGYPAVRPIVLPFTAGDGWRFDAGRWITRGARRAVNRWFHSERSPRCSAWWGAWSVCAPACARSAANASPHAGKGVRQDPSPAWGRDETWDAVRKRLRTRCTTAPAAGVRRPSTRARARTPRGRDPELDAAKAFRRKYREVTDGGRAQLRSGPEPLIPHRPACAMRVRRRDRRDSEEVAADACRRRARRRR